MSKATEIRFREEIEVKETVQAILKEMGLDLSSACRLFLRKVLQTKSIPFRMESGYTVEGEKAVLRAQKDHENERRNGRVKTYDTAKALFNDLNRRK